MSQHFDCLIVGTGHAGAQTAISLRQQNYPGSVGLLGEEFDPPYERPSLSKDYLAGDRPFARILIRPIDFWKTREISLLLGRRVTEVDAAQHSLMCADGSVFTYGSLVWAAGGAARKLACPGWQLDGVHRVRTRADVDAMRERLSETARIVVIGGGYIGLEAAAVLRKKSHQVTVLEAMDRVLARVAGEPLSRFYEHEHRSMGVDIRLGVTVRSLEGRGGRVEAVCLSSGEHVAADMVIVGIGIEPSVEALLAAGASGGNGVDVDRFCRTDLPDIYAIGDCARHANVFAGGARIRLESVQNASDQAATVAKFLTGHPEHYETVPWFWSNQYDLRLQTIGISSGHDQAVVRGDPKTRKFSVVYLKQGVVQALDCVNTVKDYVEGKGLITGRVSASPATLADTAITLKSVQQAVIAAPAAPLNQEPSLCPN
jgi:3-phenylpropionate/trans-cinnamate dioxygenase ferredoxin reductase subunit